MASPGRKPQAGGEVSVEAKGGPGAPRTVAEVRERNEAALSGCRAWGWTGAVCVLAGWGGFLAMRLWGGGGSPAERVALCEAVADRGADFAAAVGDWNRWKALAPVEDLDEVPDLFEVVGLTVGDAWAFDSVRIAKAYAAAQRAWAANDPQAVERALEDVSAVALDALEAAGGAEARQRGAEFLNSPLERARHQEVVARVTVNAKALDALEAHYTAGPGCGCEPWDRAVAAAELDTDASPALAEAAINCFRAEAPE